MPTKRKTTYQAGSYYFDSLDEARKYALKLKGTVPISRNGAYIGEVDSKYRKWRVQTKKSTVKHDPMKGYIVVRAKEKVYYLNDNGTTKSS